MFFESWAELRHILFVGTASYVALIFFLRISGKRTLSKLNAFDLVVTVALGSTLASALTQKTLSFIGAVLAFALLVGLQFVITWLSVRSRHFNRMIKSEPTILYYDGQFRENALKRERVTKEEVMSALRSQGISSMDEAAAVVIESNAELVCLRRWIAAKSDGVSSSQSTLLSSEAYHFDQTKRAS